MAVVTGAPGAGAGAGANVAPGARVTPGGSVAATAVVAGSVLPTIDDDGFVFITGRKMELIITAAGKNVAPAVLEDRLTPAAAAIILDRQAAKVVTQ